MKIYTASFDGHWMGGHVVVVASSPARAKIMIEARMQEARLGTGGEINVSSGEPLDGAKIVYFDDGDY